MVFLINGFEIVGYLYVKQRMIEEKFGLNYRIYVIKIDKKVIGKIY